MATIRRREFAGGNWKIARWNDGNCSIGSDDGHGTFATVKMRRSKTNNLTELRANANLFVASPKLYEASAKTLDVLAHIRTKLLQHNLRDEIDRLIAQHEAALALAEQP